MTITREFRNHWVISNLPKSTLTSVTVSPNGATLVVSSQTKDLNFYDFQSGVEAGTLDLSNGNFHISSSAWRSEGYLIVGSSDGQVFQLKYTPGVKVPIQMCRIFKLEDRRAMIRVLAYDPLQRILAAGSGAEVHLYTHSTKNGRDSWNSLDRIPAPPGERAEGTVTALFFFGKSAESRRLLVGHAMAGFCVWTSCGNYKRIPKGSTSSSVGSATIASDGDFIAISSLDQSIVTYPLGLEGPDFRDRREFPFKEDTNYRPIVPIALTTNNLIFKGTTSGDIPIIDSTSGPMTPIRLGPGRIIRTLTAYGDKIVVGSSATGESLQGSRIECYSTGPGIPLNEWSRPERASFKLKLSDALSYTDRAYLALGDWGMYFSVGTYLGVGGACWNRVRPWLAGRRTVKALCLIWMFTLVLTVDPPRNILSKGSSTGSNETASGPSSALTMYYERLEQEQHPTKPSLAFLLKYLFRFTAARFAIWASWLMSCIAIGLFGLLRWSIYGIWMVPRGFIFLTTEISTIMAAAICDALAENGMGHACGMGY